MELRISHIALIMIRSQRVARASYLLVVRQQMSLVEEEGARSQPLAALDLGGQF